MNEWIQMEVGRRRIVRAAPDRKASQSAHSASFFPFPSTPGFASFASLLPPPPPSSMKGCCCSSLLSCQSATRRNLVPPTDIMNEPTDRQKKSHLPSNSIDYLSRNHSSLESPIGIPIRVCFLKSLPNFRHLKFIQRTYICIVISVGSCHNRMKNDDLR